MNKWTILKTSKNEDRVTITRPYWLADKQSFHWYQDTSARIIEGNPAYAGLLVFESAEDAASLLHTYLHPFVEASLAFTRKTVEPYCVSFDTGFASERYEVVPL